MLLAASAIAQTSVCETAMNGVASGQIKPSRNQIEGIHLLAVGKYVGWIAPNAVIVINGKPSTLEDLRRLDGQKVKIVLSGWTRERPMLRREDTNETDHSFPPARRHHPETPAMPARQQRHVPRRIRHVHQRPANQIRLEDPRPNGTGLAPQNHDLALPDSRSFCFWRQTIKSGQPHGYRVGRRSRRYARKSTGSNCVRALISALAENEPRSPNSSYHFLKIWKGRIIHKQL